MDDIFEKLGNTNDPTVETATEENKEETEQTSTETATTEESTAVETKKEKTEETTETTETSTETKETTEQAQTETKPDEFIESFNKRYNTQYKTDEDIKPLFDLPKKVSQYEKDLESKADLEKRVEQYKKDLESVKRDESSKYLSKPLMRKAFVAQQLVEKFPNTDTSVLTELAMADLDKMSDIDIVAKEMKIKLPKRSLDDIKSVILDELGVDPDSEEEWSTKSMTKLDIKAAAARENIASLTAGIEIPKTETPEEAEKRVADDLQARTEAAAPLKDKYCEFSEFNIREDLNYTVPPEFKEKLGDMFDAFIIKGGNEPTEENLKILEEIRDASFFAENREEIFKVMLKDAETKNKIAEDIKNANTETPGNTATASDGLGEEGNKLPDSNDFFRDAAGQKTNSLP